MSRIKVAIVDDHQLFIEGMMSLLSKHSDVEVIGNANSKETLYELLDTAEIHVVLIDISMPSITGLELINLARESHPSVKFIVLTMHAEGQYVVKAVRSGAHGYLLKNADEQELISAIKNVYLGNKHFNKEISALMIGNMAIEGESHKRLSEREVEVLQLVSDGKTTKEIADQLFVSTRTVETHRVNIMKKLKVQNSAELIKRAVALNLI